MVHKLFIDSRAAKEGNPSDFVWAPDRPVSVGKCRAFLDAVHMPVTWGTITDTNKYMYIAEEMTAFTVLPTQTKVYLRENGVERVLTLAASIVPPYDGPGLAQALATALHNVFHRSRRNTGEHYHHLCHFVGHPLTGQSADPQHVCWLSTCPLKLARR